MDPHAVWQQFPVSRNIHFKRMLVIFLISFVLLQFVGLWYFGFHLRHYRRGFMGFAIPALIPCAIYLVLVWVWNNFFASKQTEETQEG